jgi:hypothetical protein
MFSPVIQDDRYTFVILMIKVKHAERVIDIETKRKIRKYYWKNNLFHRVVSSRDKQNEVVCVMFENSWKD